MPLGHVFGKGALVEDLDEHFDAFVVLGILEYLDRIDLLFLVVLVELKFLLEVVEELLLVAVLGEVDVFELHQAVLVQPCQAVLFAEGTFLLSLPFQYPELVIFLHVFLFFGVVPPIAVQQV